MRVDTVKTKVYEFKELSDGAKQTVLDNLRSLNTDGFTWWESVYEDAKEIGKLMGIAISDIYFSGFSSKGDGACFEGCYEYVKGSRAAVKAHAPKDTELLRIATELATEQRKCFYQIRASVKQDGHYSHRYCTDIDVDFESHATGYDYHTADAEKAVIELLRDYMLWIYKRLEAEDDYRTSDAAIIEGIEANEYEFTAEGELYN